jgi:hypothetical protein
MKAIARGQITLVDLNDAKSLNMYLGCNQAATQIFNKENSSYVPNYPSTPCVITPELYVSGTSTNIIGQLKGTPTWTINGSSEFTAFGATVGTSSPWALTIKSNMSSVSQMRIECTGVWTDPDTKVDLTVKAMFTLTKTTNAGQLCCAIAYAPNGTIFKNGDITSLKGHCDLWRGSTIDNTQVSYQWQKLVNGIWVNLTSANAGYNTNEVTIAASDVLNFDSFRCVIKDTDPASGTYNTSFSDILSFADLSDPYVVEISSSTGDKLLNGTGSTTLKATVWQNGNAFSDADSAKKFVFTWTKMNSDGTQDTAWGDVTNKTYTKTGQAIVVTASEITNKAIFLCELSYA